MHSSRSRLARCSPAPSSVDLLAAICLFVNGDKGMSAVQFSRDLDVQYKTAFVLAHKLRYLTSTPITQLGWKIIVAVQMVATPSPFSAARSIIRYHAFGLGIGSELKAKGKFRGSTS